MEEAWQPISSSFSLPEQAISDSSLENSPKTLPNMLIIEIFTWLPAKTLVRFRCVSKSWRTAISDPSFIKSHLRKSSNRDDYAHHRVLFRSWTSSGGTRVRNYDTRYFRLTPALSGDAKTPIESNLVEDTIMNGREGRIVNCSNGIVCVCVDKDILFWNPTIRKFKKLPKFSGLPEKRGQCQVYFEYNEVDEDYQVCLLDFGEKRITIYSGKTNTWRGIRGFVGQSDLGYFIARGKLYWQKGNSRGAEIGFFDLKTGTCGVVEQPNYGKTTFDLKCGPFQGSLAVLCYYRTSHIDLWVMKELWWKKSWTKALLLPKYKDQSRKKSCIPIFMSKDGNILFGHRKCMVLSDPMKKSVTYPRVKSFGEPWQIEAVVESLVLLDDHDVEGPVKDIDVSSIDLIRHLAPDLA